MDAILAEYSCQFEHKLIATAFNELTTMVEAFNQADDFILIIEYTGWCALSVVESLIVFNSVELLAEFIEINLRVIGFKAYSTHITVLLVEVFRLEVLSKCSESALVFNLVAFWYSDDCFQPIA